MRRRAIRRTTRRRVRRRMRRRWTRRLIIGGMVVLAVGGTAAAYKFSQRDVERIEQDTGKKAEELTEEELKAAMQRLGIQSLELTEADEEALDTVDEEEERGEGTPPAASQPAPPAAAAEPAPASPPAAAAPAASPAGEPDYIDQIKRLGELNQQGIISDEEFAAMKKKLLGL